MMRLDGVGYGDNKLCCFQRSDHPFTRQPVPDLDDTSTAKILFSCPSGPSSPSPFASHKCGRLIETIKEKLAVSSGEVCM